MSKLDDELLGIAEECGCINHDISGAKGQLKTLIRDLIDETFDKDDAKALELWKKVESL